MLLSILALALSGLVSGAHASNYPADYCDQTVNVLNDGPVLFAHVGSGCTSAFVVGYKWTGPLAKSNPDHIDMVVKASCETNGSRHIQETVVRLGKEWHGTGYMSASLSNYGFLPDFCYNPGVDYSRNLYEFAFSDGQSNWDSKFGYNYRLNSLTFTGGAQLATHENGFQVNQKAWDFIIDQMRR